MDELRETEYLMKEIGRMNDLYNITSFIQRKRTRQVAKSLILTTCADHQSDVQLAISCQLDAFSITSKPHVRHPVNVAPSSSLAST